MELKENGNNTDEEHLDIPSNISSKNPSDEIIPTTDTEAINSFFKYSIESPPSVSKSESHHFQPDNKNPTFALTKTILKRVFNILFLAFYTLGTLCLPMGDFAMLKDLPERFRHCKATEDRDLNVFEFLTEHVSAIGQLIERAEHEAEEDGDKPHEPIQSINCGQTIVFVISQFAFSITQFYLIDVKQHPIHIDIFFTSDYISKLFRPPIVA